MASTIKSVAQLSRDLGMTEETLIRESIIEYIKSRIKACMRDRLEIMSRYQVPSLDEFEKRVQDGSIPEHPGWEDLITLENIETRVNKLKMELSHSEIYLSLESIAREFKEVVRGNKTI